MHLDLHSTYNLQIICTSISVYLYDLIILSKFLFFSVSRYLYKDELMPKCTKIVGYARSDLTVDKLRAKTEPFMKVLNT